MNSHDGDAASPSAQLFGIVSVFMGSNMIFAAIKLGVAGLIGDGPVSCDELATRPVGTILPEGADWLADIEERRDARGAVKAES